MIEDVVSVGKQRSTDWKRARKFWLYAHQYLSIKSKLLKQNAQLLSQVCTTKHSRIVYASAGTSYDFCWRKGLVIWGGLASEQRRRQGRGTGPWPPLGAEGALCDCLAPSNRECVYRANVVGGRRQAPSNADKSLFGPEGAWGRPQARKVPPKSSSNDDHTASSLGEVAPS